MNDEKRMIDTYEVTNSVHIGGKEILFAEDLTASEPYLVCSHTTVDFMGYYSDGEVTADYVEAMEAFVARIADETQHIKQERATLESFGISDQPLTIADCIPQSNLSDYTGQLVVIRPERMAALARTADKQLLYAKSGFGCNPNSRGNAVYCTKLLTSETVRWERYDIAGIIRPDRIPAWAHQKLKEMSIAQKSTDPISRTKAQKPSVTAQLSKQEKEPGRLKKAPREAER